MKIDKAYRPELLVSKGKEPNPLMTDPYLDVKSKRLVATNDFALVALPVGVDPDEHSRYLACSLLQAGRALGDPELPAEIKNEKIVEFGVLWPAAQERTFPDWQKVMPKFKRGSEGTVTFALNPGLLAKLATAMGLGGVCLTIELGRAEDLPSPIVVQPLNPKAPELGLLMPMGADGAGEAILMPGQVCPVCRRLLAPGAVCPEHGSPLKKDGAATPALTWQACKGGIEAVLPDGGSLRIGADGAGFGLFRVKPGKRGFTRLGHFPTTVEAQERAARILTEDATDDLLKNSGDGSLTKKELKGEAVARKKGRRS